MHSLVVADAGNVVAGVVDKTHGSSTIISAAKSHDMTLPHVLFMEELIDLVVQIADLVVRQTVWSAGDAQF